MVAIPQESATGRSPASKRGEYPAQPLHLTARETRLWLTGVPFPSGINGDLPAWTDERRGLTHELQQRQSDLDSAHEEETTARETLDAAQRDVRTPRRTLDALHRKLARREAAKDRAREQVQAALDGFMAAGLERRVSPSPKSPGSPFGAHVWNEDKLVYLKLVAMGAKPPPRIGVCEQCWIVFATSRKSFGAKCPRCHGSPRPEMTEERGGLGKVPIGVAREVFDPETLDPSGWRRIYVKQCRKCRETFTSSRRDQGYCSSRCRVQAHRSRRKTCGM